MAEARLAGGSRWVRALAGLAVTTLVASGCATIPTVGTPQSAPAPPVGGVGGSECCGLEVSGPRAGMSATAVVSGFLLASAGFAQDPKVAREYLEPKLRSSWPPARPVTILAANPKVTPMPQKLPRPPAGVGGGKAHTATVLVRGQEVATLDSSGQYIRVGGHGLAQSQEVFSLAMIGGKYLITSSPKELLLTKSLFDAMYQPRNLYYTGLGGRVLVPDSVFVAQDAANPVKTLVRDLLSDPSGLLQGAARTAFPPGARLEKVQLLPGLAEGKTAIISIHVPRDTSAATKSLMARQLVLTLTSAVYTAAPARAVELEINGRPWSPGRGVPPVLTLDQYRRYLSHGGSDSSLYFLNRQDAVSVLGRVAAHSSRVPGPAGTGDLPLKQVAVSPDGRYLAGISRLGTLYTADLPAAARHAPAGNLRPQLSGSSGKAISWDSSDNLWVAATSHGTPGVWVLPHGQGPAISVVLAAGIDLPGHPATRVTGLRIAPDGVRAALIVGSGNTSRLLLGAISHAAGGYSILQTVPLGGQNLSGVTSVTWYGEDRVLAVTRSHSGAQLLNVPVNGDLPALVAAPEHVASVTADGSQNPLYIALSTGQLEKSVGPGDGWTASGTGQDPVYPG